ncbi:MAG TPA: hypothetical protein VK064_08105 [Wenzhouxiangella sp.]|nr:hypothetical protein [Wenzhouxiangella sp.]
METKASSSVKRFSYHLGWDQLTRSDADDIIAFWQREKALPEGDDGRARVSQVVFFARDSEDEIAAVSTAVPKLPPRLGQPVLYYRTYVAPAWRRTRLVYNLLRRSVNLLEQDAARHDYPCIGILIELENERFGQMGRMPIWPKRAQFVYVGLSPRGLECRVYWFRKARLKPAPALARPQNAVSS